MIPEDLWTWREHRTCPCYKCVLLCHNPINSTIQSNYCEGIEMCFCCDSGKDLRIAGNLLVDVGNAESNSYCSREWILKKKREC